MLRSLSHHAHGVAMKCAAPLDALVEPLDIGRGFLRGTRHADFQRVRVQADMGKAAAHHIGAPHQQGLAQAGILEGESGADNRFVLAFGEHHPLGLGAHRRRDGLEQGGGRIEPRRQLIGIMIEVLDLAPGDARLHRRFRHRPADMADQARIERHRNDVVGTIDRPRSAIGGGDFVGHVLARQRRQRFGGGDLHRFVDGAGAHIQRAAEDIGKAQHIVDLVGIVAAAGGDDGVGAHGLHIFRRDFGIGIGHGEDDRRLGHALDHVLGERALGGHADQYIRANNRFGQSALVGDHGMGRLPLIEIGAVLVQHADFVHRDAVFRAHAHRLDQFQGGDARRARPVQHHFHVFQLAGR